MRVIHFALMSPNQAGLYGTVRDLIAGERRQGISAEIVDYGYDGKDEERMLSDGWLSCVHWQEALRCDLVIRHSAAPKAVLDVTPFLLALHGRPINTFLLSFQYGRKFPIIETLYQATERETFRGFISFWPYNTRTWRELLAPWPVYQVPAPVDLERFSPEGKKHRFSGDYDVRVLIADMWREDSCPVTPIFATLEAAATLAKTTGLRVQVNAVGVPKRGRELLTIIREKSRTAHLGDIYPMVGNIELLYRASDVVVTSAGVATRIVRESFACGTPVLTTAAAPDYRPSVPINGGGTLADAIITLMATERETRRRESRAYAETVFDRNRAGAVMKSVFEQVLR